MCDNKKVSNLQKKSDREIKELYNNVYREKEVELK